jgi:hypothetical protein
MKDLSPIQKSNAIVGQLQDTIDIGNATMIQKYLAGLLDTLENQSVG